MTAANNIPLKEKESISRRLAVLCLTAWAGQREPIGPLVEAIIHGSRLRAADRHLAVNLVQGVLRQLQYLDLIIARFSRFPLEKMKPLTIMTLRVGVYQVMFLERIPESAAVNETVKVMKLENQPRWLLNFVNGVLRSIVRNKSKLPRAFAVKTEKDFPLNHPDWLVKRWQDRYGIELTRLICRENNKEPLLTLRVNILRTGQDELAEMFMQKGYRVRPGKYVRDALVVESFTGPVANLPGYEEGLFHVQDEAAQLVTQLLGPFTRQGNYLDGCAGLGGKTCQLAQLLHPQEKLFAVEPNTQRVKLLQENLRRLRLERVSVFPGRLDAYIPTIPGNFEGVLIDAPCSGTGVIRRHPDIRWNRQPEDLPVYQRQQQELLAQGASLVVPGGTLVYATCSMEPEENSRVIESFLGKYSDFIVADCRQYLPAAAAGMVSPAGFFASTPADGLDGFFGARLERTR